MLHSGLQLLAVLRACSAVRQPRLPGSSQRALRHAGQHACMQWAVHPAPECCNALAQPANSLLPRPGAGPVSLQAGGNDARPDQLSTSQEAGPAAGDTLHAAHTSSTRHQEHHQGHQEQPPPSPPPPAEPSGTAGTAGRHAPCSLPRSRRRSAAQGCQVAKAAAAALLVQNCRARPLCSLACWACCTASAQLLKAPHSSLSCR